MSSATPFATSLEHVIAEIGFIELLVREEVERFKRSAPDQTELLRGVFISEAEVADTLSQMSGGSRERATRESREAITALEQEIAARRQASLEQEVYLSLPRLGRVFGLTRFEELLMLLCLAPEIDARYEKVYAYLQDDVTRKQPRIELALRLLCSTEQERIRARACFASGAPLFRARILSHQGSDGDPLLGRTLRLDEQIVNHLLDAGTISRDIAEFCRPMSAPVDQLERLRWPDALKQRLSAITRGQVSGSLSTPRRLIYHFHGPAGTGK